jgi:hypothetical protein
MRLKSTQLDATESDSTLLHLWTIGIIGEAKQSSGTVRLYSTVNEESHAEQYSTVAGDKTGQGE